MMRYFIRIKIEQQKILALTTTTNKTIQDAKTTLNIVNASYMEYQTN